MVKTGQTVTQSRQSARRKWQLEARQLTFVYVSSKPLRSAADNNDDETFASRRFLRQFLDVIQRISSRVDGAYAAIASYDMAL